MTAPKHDEVDAWWGSCSVSSVVPGLLVSLAASVLVIGLAWILPHNGAEQFIVMSLLGAFWLFLLIFGIYRIFGLNYRLTTRRLFIEVGLKHRRLHIVDLKSIAQVSVRTGPLERLLGIGRIHVEVKDGAAPFVLKGVLGPQVIADKIRSLSNEAHKQI